MTLGLGAEYGQREAHSRTAAKITLRRLHIVVRMPHTRDRTH